MGLGWDEEKKFIIPKHIIEISLYVYIQVSRQVNLEDLQKTFRFLLHIQAANNSDISSFRQSDKFWILVLFCTTIFGNSFSQVPIAPYYLLGPHNHHISF